MPFTPTNFQNGNPATPVSATQLNKLGTQYAAVAADAGNPATPVGAALSTAIDAAVAGVTPATFASVVELEAAIGAGDVVNGQIVLVIP